MVDMMFRSFNSKRVLGWDNDEIMHHTILKYPHIRIIDTNSTKPSNLMLKI